MEWIVLIIIVIFATSHSGSSSTPTRSAPPEPIPDYATPRKSWSPPLKKVTINYDTYITSDEWYENPVRKLRVHKADGKCELCSSNNHPEVHHITYENLGKEEYSDIILLCRECHEHTHKVAGKGAKSYPPIRRTNG